MSLSIHRVMHCAAIALSCLVMTHGVDAAPSFSKARSKAKLAATALAAQRDTDPDLNGSIGSASDLPSEEALRVAAEASRRDQDPSINGTVSSYNSGGTGRDAVAKR
jgi:hypothetical protein